MRENPYLAQDVRDLLERFVAAVEIIADAYIPVDAELTPVPTGPFQGEIRTIQDGDVRITRYQMPDKHWLVIRTAPDDEIIDIALESPLGKRDLYSLDAVVQRYGFLPFQIAPMKRYDPDGSLNPDLTDEELGGG